LPTGTKTAVESPSSRRFGELLVADGVITQEQLDAALRLQTVARAYVPIGQVLLANKLITRKKLNALLHRYGKRSRLGAILVKAGHISVAQLEEALAQRTHMPLGRALISLGHLDEITMRDALCTQLHVNFFDLDNIAVDQRLASIISQRFAARHLIVPLFRVGEILVVAVDDPSQAAVIEGLEGHLGLRIEIVTTTTAKLMAAMKRLYGPETAPDVNPFVRRNILLGPIRDFVVAELAVRVLKGVSVVPF
jgi:type IV pilus assembly protein PilB